MTFFVYILWCMSWIAVVRITALVPEKYACEQKVRQMFAPIWEIHYDVMFIAKVRSISIANRALFKIIEIALTWAPLHS